MAFYFNTSKGDKLMTKINLRDISLRAKQWDHPAKGLFKYAESMKENGQNILKLHKKDREYYCISLVVLALMEDSNLDWWINIPAKDPPDGLIMTLVKEKSGLKSHMREIEVVEHRGQSNGLFDIIKNKMIEKSYEPNTILACLLLTSDLYDLKDLSLKLSSIKSSLDHIFVVFSGIPLDKKDITEDQLKTTFTMVQLLPKYEITTFNYKPYLEDFMKRYNDGQESRLIENNQVYFGTSNRKYNK